MANWSLPTITDLYTNILDYLKNRDVDCARMFSTDYTVATSIETGTIRWNATNDYWEIYSGSAWSGLIAKYLIDVDTLDGQHGLFYQNASNLNAGTLPAARFASVTTGIGFVVDEDDMTSNSNTKVPTQQSVVSYVTNAAITITDKEFTDYRENAASIASTGAVTLNTATASYFYNAATTGVITFTFSGAAASGKVTSFTLELFGGGTNAPVWPASVDWADGIQPSWSVGVDIVSFSTRDGGTTWLGYYAGGAFA